MWESIQYTAAILLLLMLLWVIVRVISSAWFSAKRAHMEALIDEMDRSERNEKGKHNGG